MFQFFPFRRIVVVRCKDGQLSDEVAKLNVGGDAPYRMALHPSGRSLVMGMTMGGIKRADIKFNPTNKHEPPTLTIAGEEFDEKGSKFGFIKTLSFSSDGRLLAMGSEDGCIDVVDWPSLKPKLHWKVSEKAVRNVDFSAVHNDGVLSSVDESGACKFWGLGDGELVWELHAPADLPRATFFRCKSTVDEDGIALYAAIKWKGEGYILRFRQDENGEIQLESRSKRPVTPAPICGFEASHSGRLLAAVTPDGDQCVISAATLKRVKYRKGAHMTFATAVAFAPDDSAILSTSADASATLTMIGTSVGVATGIGIVLTLLGVLLLLIAIVVGMLRRFAEQAPGEAAEMMGGLPDWAQHLILPMLSQ